MRRLPGEHEPNNKNRSSKQNTWLTKIRPIVRCVSTEYLSKSNFPGASKELERRSRVHEKNEVRKQRYLEKLESKKLNKKEMK